jgi:hypothetical protein
MYAVTEAILRTLLEADGLSLGIMMACGRTQTFGDYVAPASTDAFCIQEDGEEVGAGLD